VEKDLGCQQLQWLFRSFEFDITENMSYDFEKSLTFVEEPLMESVRVLAKGQIVIPAALRKKYGIAPGAELGIFEYGRLIHIVPPSEDPVASAMGCLPDQPSLTEELLRERKKDFSA
jgi:AbrB family looped-hinge helix DNA binding protein